MRTKEVSPPAQNQIFKLLLITHIRYKAYKCNYRVQDIFNMEILKAFGLSDNINVVWDNDTPLFKAKDIANILDISNIHEEIKEFQPKEKIDRQEISFLTAVLLVVNTFWARAMANMLVKMTIDRLFNLGGIDCLQSWSNT